MLNFYFDFFLENIRYMNFKRIFTKKTRDHKNWQNGGKKWTNTVATPFCYKIFEKNG